MAEGSIHVVPLGPGRALRVEVKADRDPVEVRVVPETDPNCGLLFKLDAAGSGNVELDLIGTINRLRANGTEVVRLGTNALGFFGVAAVGQQADISVLTDNTAGTANNTLQAVPDPADAPASADILRDDIVANDLPAIRNNFADLASQVNDLRTVLRNLGLMA